MDYNQEPPVYMSVFADIETSKREENAELFERFERMLSNTSEVEDGEVLINVSYVKHLRKDDEPGMIAWSALWHENEGKNVFGAFYHSIYQDEGISFLSLVRPLQIVQKQVQVVDVTYYLPNGLPFHCDFKYDFVDYSALYA